MKFATVVSVAAVGLCGTLRAEDAAKAPVAAPAAAPSKVYTLPDDFEGTAMDKTDGNPAMVDGKAMWRIDQIWPDDPMVAKNYIPMPWNGKGWNAKENTFGGQPGAGVGEQKITLAVRAGWQGSTESKLAALVFIAPAAGKYTVAAKVNSDLWAGDKATPFDLRLLKIDKKAGTVSKVKKVELVSGTPRDLADITVDLAEGDEIAFVPTFPQMHMAASVTFSDVKIAKQ